MKLDGIVSCRMTVVYCGLLLRVQIKADENLKSLRKVFWKDFHSLPVLIGDGSG